MRGSRILRAVQLFAMVMVLSQVGGCTSTEILNFVQTILLGITAAGAIAIIKNI